MREFRTAAAESMGYYIAISGVQQGPFELNDLPGKGLRADSLVWTEGMTDWKRADQVPEVAALFAVPAAAPPQAPPELHPLGTLQYATPVSKPQDGMAVASLVLGILAYPLYCAQGLGIVASILAIVFGFIARSRSKRGETSASMALAGIILGLVPFAVIIFFFLIAMFVIVVKVATRH